MRTLFSWLAVAVLALGTPGLALAGNLVTNGDFTDYTGGVGQLVPGVGATTVVTGWTVDGSLASMGNPGVWLFDGNNIAAGSAMQGGPIYLWGPPTPPPSGGNILALAGDAQYCGNIWQEIAGLTAAHTYEVSFYRAGGQLTSFSGATHTSVQVDFGSDTQTTSVLDNASQSWTGGWIRESFQFTATSSTQILRFLALGNPENVPPIVLLSGVELRAVPEPSSIVALGVGLVGIGLVRRFRKRSS